MQGIQPVSTRHRQVQYDQIPLMLPRQLEKFRGSGCFPNYHPLKLIGQHLLDPATHKWVIVGDENPYHATPLKSGNRTFTVVPIPSVPRIDTSPPHCAARSRIPSSPKEFWLARIYFGIPRPLSHTSNTSQLGVMSRWIRMLEAWA